nr:hypothetical protein CTI12_AA439960 [Tanacetum cinerariifolium]
MSSSNSNIMTIDVNYNGISSKSQLNYSLGVVKTIDHVDFGGMDFNYLGEFLEKLTRTKYSRRIGLYVDHYDEDLTHLVGKDKLADLIMGVDSDTSDAGSKDSDPSYHLSEDEDDISDSISLAQDDDNDDDE